MKETWVRSLCWEDPLEEVWQPTPVFLPGESPWTEEPGGLQSMWLKRVWHDWWLSPAQRSIGGFPGSASSKESACKCRRHKRCGFHPWVRKIPWRKKWQPTPVFLLEKVHGQRSLEGYSPWCCKELDTTEHVHTQTPEAYVFGKHLEEGEGAGRNLLGKPGEFFLLKSKSKELQGAES